MKMKHAPRPKDEHRVSEMVREQNEQPVGEQLAAQVQRTPWWMISMAAHILLLILFALVIYENPIEPMGSKIVFVEDGGNSEPQTQRPPDDSEDNTNKTVPVEDNIEVEAPSNNIDTINTIDSPLGGGLDIPEVKMHPPSGEIQNIVFPNVDRSYVTGALRDPSSVFPGGPGDPTKPKLPSFGVPLHPIKKPPMKPGRPGGPTKETNAAVKAGLAWLATHQNSDGSWDPNPGTTGQHKVAITSMALLAFFGEGYSDRGPKYSSTVRKGVDWLLNDVDESTGKFKSAGVLYEQGLGTMALNEAYGMLIKRAKDKAIAANRYIIAAQTDKGGWNYNPGGQNGDTSVTGFQVQALKLAKEVKLGIDSEVNAALKKAREWVEFANDKNGNTGYSGPAKGSIALTAAGAWMRMYTDSTRSGDDQVRLAVQNLGQQLPAWDSGAANQVNMYYLYYGTLVSFQWDGAPWKEWDAAMKKYMTASQIMTEGDTKGSWSPAGQWSANWGRAGQTALSVLCLEVYYRYPRFFK